jgi:hypothetical protein
MHLGMNASLAPIVLLAFKRPFATLQVLYSLSRCAEASESELYVFCDAARNDAERSDVDHTREVIRSRKWCGRVEVIEAEKNQGCARSVIGAVTRLCASHGRVIVLEDDLLVSRGFLTYMNEGLRRFADDDRVMLVSAHSFDAFPPEPRAMFLPVATTWGWGTWSRAWSKFQESPPDLRRLDERDVQRSFDLDDSFDYTKMLRAQLAGQIDSWGILWWWCVHSHRGLGLFPRQSMVKNIGIGPGATHTTDAGALLMSNSWSLDNEIAAFPSEVRVDEPAWEAWRSYLQRMRMPPRSFAHRLIDRGASLLHWATERLADKRGRS